MLILDILRSALRPMGMVLSMWAVLGLTFTGLGLGARWLAVDRPPNAKTALNAFWVGLAIRRPGRNAFALAVMLLLVLWLADLSIGPKRTYDVGFYHLQTILWYQQ